MRKHTIKAAKRNRGKMRFPGTRSLPLLCALILLCMISSACSRQTLDPAASARNSAENIPDQTMESVEISGGDVKTEESAGTPDEAPEAEAAAGTPDEAPEAETAAGTPDETPEAETAAGTPDEAPEAEIAAGTPDETPEAETAAGTPDGTPEAETAAGTPDGTPDAETTAGTSGEHAETVELSEQPSVKPTVNIWGILSFGLAVGNLLFTLALWQSFRRMRKEAAEQKEAEVFDMEALFRQYLKKSDLEALSGQYQEKLDTLSERLDQMSKPASPPAKAAPVKVENAPVKAEKKYFKVTQRRTQDQPVFLTVKAHGGEIVGEADPKDPIVYYLSPVMQNMTPDHKIGTVASNVLYTGNIKYCFDIEPKERPLGMDLWISVEALACVRQDGDQFRLTRPGKLRVTGTYY